MKNAKRATSFVLTLAMIALLLAGVTMGNIATAYAGVDDYEWGERTDTTSTAPGGTGIDNAGTLDELYIGFISLNPSSAKVLTSTAATYTTPDSTKTPAGFLLEGPLTGVVGIYREYVVVASPAYSANYMFIKLSDVQLDFATPIDSELLANSWAYSLPFESIDSVYGHVFAGSLCKIKSITGKFAKVDIVGLNLYVPLASLHF